MVYSPAVDGAYCINCALLVPISKRGNKGAFVNQPFTNFHKLDEKAKGHENNDYHQDACAAANLLAVVQLTTLAKMLTIYSRMSSLRT